MAMAVKTLVLGLNPKIMSLKQTGGFYAPTFSSKRAFSLQMRYSARGFCQTDHHKCFHAVCAVSSGLEEIGVTSSQFEDFSVTATNTNNANELKINVVVSGAKTQAIFDDVFSKMVADAQPIPGFRRLKGGQMPDIPRDVLVHVLGTSKVYNQVIKKVINSTIAEYVEKEGLAVSKDLRVEQSFEDLDATFEAGNEFSFDAIVQRLK